MKTNKIGKLSLSVIAVMFFCFSLSAQKPTLKNIKVKYTQLPLMILDESIKTYNSVLNMELTLENTDNEKLRNRYLKLYGFGKVKEDEDILITADFGKFDINKELITKSVFNVNQGKNVTGYYYKISCAYPTNICIKSKDGKIIFEQKIEPNVKKMNFNFEKWTYSKSELDAKFNTKKKELFSELKNKYDKKALKEIQNILSSNFSYLPVTEKIKIASGKGKKMDYSDLETGFQHIQKAFELMSSESGQDKVSIELKNAIEIYEKAVKESSDNKKARINKPITTMLYYNIGIAYWWNLDFSKAKEYFEQALKQNTTCRKPSSSKEKLIKETIENMNDYEKRLKIHGKL